LTSEIARARNFGGEPAEPEHWLQYESEDEVNSNHDLLTLSLISPQCKRID